MVPWLMITIAVLLIVLALLFYRRVKYGKTAMKPANPYKNLFILGLIFFIIGLGSGNPSMWTIGLCLFALGFVNKDKWNRNLTKKEQLIFQKLTIVGLIAFFILFLLGIFVFKFL